MIDKAIRQKEPFSLVRIGDGENLVMAQRYVLPIESVLNSRWGRLSHTTKRKGIILPNENARKKIIRAVKRADLVGIPYYKDPELRAPQKYLRKLTDKCFQTYGIRPNRVCHTLVNRHLVEEKAFWNMLRGRRVAVISKWASSFSKLVQTEYADFDIKIAAEIPITQYGKIEEVIQKMQNISCDIVLISAGVNAVIIADKLARLQGRVAIDFGKSAMFMVTGKTDRVRPWRGEHTP